MKINKFFISLLTLNLLFLSSGNINATCVLRKNAASNVGIILSLVPIVYGLNTIINEPVNWVRQCINCSNADTCNNKRHGTVFIQKAPTPTEIKARKIKGFSLLGLGLLGMGASDYFRK